MAPPRFDELTKKQRRRLLGRAIGRVGATTVLLFGLYYVLPVENKTETSAVVMLGIGLVVFVAALAYQVRQIISADYPQLRAVEAAGIAVPLLIIVFAFVYLNLSVGDGGTFSEPLTRSGSLYFTITVLSTVGFGDITPIGDTPRLIVSLQMMLDLVLIGFILRLLTGAARTGLQRQQVTAVNEPPATATAAVAPLLAAGGPSNSLDDDAPLISDLIAAEEPADTATTDPRSPGEPTTERNAPASGTGPERSGP